MSKNKLDLYRDGGEGYIAWMEDNVRIPIIPFGKKIPVLTYMKNLPDTPHPETGRSWKSFWEEQKAVAREALVMKNGVFKHRLVVFCWPRGDGKSFMTVTIKLWRFFNFPSIKVALGANSKDQVQFVHYDEMKNIIYNSPKLLRTLGEDNIREKSIIFRDGQGRIGSEIKTISSFSGIVSNITDFTFSEFFDQRKTDFYTRLHGSIRNITNSMGCIDSTVSTRTHQLYKLYQAFIAGEDTTLYFSYRCSKDGDPADYLNPNMTEKQLHSYRVQFPFGDFEKFFLNLWEAAGGKVFPPEMIEATNYLGVDGRVNCHNSVIEFIERREKAYQQKEMIEHGDPDTMNADTDSIVNEVASRLWPVEAVFRLRSRQNQPIMPTISDFERLSDLYDTNWALIGGLDRGDPAKTKTSARTIIAVLAKGYPGSRSNPNVVSDGENPLYLYLLLHLAVIDDHSLEGIKHQFQQIHQQFDGLDIIGSERYGAWDLANWCEYRNIGFELWVSNYNRQKEMFSELYNAIRYGRFKAPPIAIPGYHGDDLLKEELGMFEHIPPTMGATPGGTRKTGFYGSPEKSRKDGVQDDVIFTLGACCYSGRTVSVLDFRERKGKIDFGSFYEAEGLLGTY